MEENKVKQFRKDLEEELKRKEINFLEWKLVRSYIEERYENKKEKSTL